MKRYAVDAGPLVALLNECDSHHEWARTTLDAIEPPLHTCEAVISEACYLVGALPKGPQTVLSLVSQGLVVVDFHLDDGIAAVERLVAKYASVPMSFADACLVRMSELHADVTIVTVDADFTVYRRHGRDVIPVLMP